MIKLMEKRFLGLILKGLPRGKRMWKCREAPFKTLYSGIHNEGKTVEFYAQKIKGIRGRASVSYTQLNNQR